VRERRQPAGRQRAEQRLLRGGAAPATDRERRLDVGLEQGGERRAAAAELEAAERAGRVRVRAVEQAVGARRHGVEEEPELARHRRQPIRRGRGAVGVRRPRAQIAVHEPPHRLHDHLLLVVELEVHARSCTASTVRMDCKCRYFSRRASRLVGPRG
jgi:hypothetical protein